MDLKSKKIKQKLIAKRRDVRNKLDLLKHGEFVRENMFSPITKHLKNIEDKIGKSAKEESPVEMGKSNDLSSTALDQSAIPHYNEFKAMQSSYKESTPEKKRQRVASDPGESHGSKLAIIHELKSEEENEKKNSSNVSKRKLNKTVPAILEETYGQEITDESFQDYLDQYDQLPRFYIKAMLSDDKNEFDHKYGVRHIPDSEKFYIGDSQLTIEGPDIIVKNKRYKGTRGLYELLFKKFPKYFTQHDEQAYKDIVLKTNAHRRY